MTNDYEDMQTSSENKYYLNPSESTFYSIVEQTDEATLLHRIVNSEITDPTPYIVAVGFSINEKNCIEWDYGHYYSEELPAKQKLNTYKTIDDGRIHLTKQEAKDILYFYKGSEEENEVLTYEIDFNLTITECHRDTMINELYHITNGFTNTDDKEDERFQDSIYSIIKKIEGPKCSQVLNQNLTRGR